MASLVLANVRNPTSAKIMLKDPSHIGHIPEVLAAYPKAKIINIHRDPTDAIGSFLQLN